MEKKKFDFNTIIGFGLIFVIIVWMSYNSQADEVKEQAKAKQAKVEQAKTAATNAKEIVPMATATDSAITDSVKMKQLAGTLGSFAYSATLPSAKENFTILENEFIKLKVANKGGQVVEVVLKNFERFTKNSGELVELIKNNNASFKTLYCLKIFRLG